MKIAMLKDIFVAHASYEERVLLGRDGAGWLWHGGECRPDCKACAAALPLKRWWTADKVRAARLINYADPETAKVLVDVQIAQKASRATDATIDTPCNPGLAYLPFQRAGIAYGRAHPRVLFGDEMGLGKTIESIGCINDDPTVHSVLVVCPATLRGNWAREMARWLTRQFMVRVIKGRENLRAGDDIVIINYEKIVGARGAPLLGALMDRKWDMLIVDECHYMKSDKAQRTVAVLGKGKTKTSAPVAGLLSVARRALFLTGTPILNRPREVWTLAHALAPEEFTSFFGFAKRYCAAVETRFGWDFDGASNLPELQERLRAHFLIRRLKSEVLTELPAKRRQIIILPTNGAAKAVEAEAEAAAQYTGILQNLQDEVDLAHAAGDEAAYKTAVDALRRGHMVAFEQMSQVRHDTAVAKVPDVIAHVDDMIEECGKIVLWAHHHDVVAGLEEHFGAACVVVTGETPMEARQGLVDRFQTDATCKVFIGSVSAAGVGITLTAASHVVFAELPWTPGELSQAEDRCHRIGQAESVLVQHLVLDGSLDAKMAQTLVDKQAIADKALDLPFERDLPAVPLPRTHRPAKYPPAEPAQKEAALMALRVLSRMCDGAASRDDVGFNGGDSRIGKALAGQVDLTDGQYWLARRILPKYHRQVGDELLAKAGCVTYPDTAKA